MKREQAVRVAAVCMSVALVAAYVVWRSIGTTESGQPATVPVAGQPVGDVTTTLVNPDPPEMFVGSKSAAVIPAPKPQRMMGGSKRMEIIEPTDLEPTKTAPPSTPKQDPKPNP